MRTSLTISGLAAMRRGRCVAAVVGSLVVGGACRGINGTTPCGGEPFDIAGEWRSSPFSVGAYEQ